ncbi:2-amino-4-hydroxy-6-hydroxymethyldihydropteridine diphosphokinase, partial [Candidatus Peregrinibacteria bacterium]|nr:2-amino-4-hydroxy-6-hydroxymethyldihydropteridine diphosphokinase [Candidatus Peregrinibacteria bacterium]
MHRVYLAFGSNLGERGKNIQTAVTDLERWGIKILRMSRLYETEPVGVKDQPAFYNAA